MSNLLPFQQCQIPQKHVLLVIVIILPYKLRIFIKFYQKSDHIESSTTLYCFVRSNRCNLAELSPVRYIERQPLNNTIGASNIVIIRCTMVQECSASIYHHDPGIFLPVLLSSTHACSSLYPVAIQIAAPVWPRQTLLRRLFGSRRLTCIASWSTVTSVQYFQNLTKRGA